VGGGEGTEAVVALAVDLQPEASCGRGGKLPQPANGAAVAGVGLVGTLQHRHGDELSRQLARMQFGHDPAEQVVALFEQALQVTRLEGPGELALVAAAVADVDQCLQALPIAGLWLDRGQGGFAGGRFVLHRRFDSGRGRRRRRGRTRWRRCHRRCAGGQQPRQHKQRGHAHATGC
jgi:hypothetical protein